MRVFSDTGKTAPKFLKRRCLLKRCLLEYKTFVSFILPNLSFYSALAVRKDPHTEGVLFNSIKFILVLLLQVLHCTSGMMSGEMD